VAPAAAPDASATHPVTVPVRPPAKPTYPPAPPPALPWNVTEQTQARASIDDAIDAYLRGAGADVRAAQIRMVRAIAKHTSIA
jgi:hypothetical protein